GGAGPSQRLARNTRRPDETAAELALNEIGRVRLRTTVPLLADEYRRNRTTGGFILIDEATNRTVAAGMIVEASGERRRATSLHNACRRRHEDVSERGWATWGRWPQAWLSGGFDRAEEG